MTSDKYGFKNILLPIDVSRKSSEGMEKARDIARKTNGKITLLCPLHGRGDNTGKNKLHHRDNGGEAFYWQRDEEDIIEKFEYLRGLRIQYHTPRIRIEFVVSEFETKHEIREFVQNRKIDLVVIDKNLQSDDSAFFIRQLPSRENADESTNNLIVKDVN